MDRMPKAVIQKVVDSVLEGDANDWSVDFRDREYAAIPLVNKSWLDAYLHFYSQLRLLTYRYSPPDEVEFYRRISNFSNDEELTDANETALTNVFNGPYKASRGVLKLLAAHRKLAKLKWVKLTLVPELCAHITANSSPIECLLQLLGVSGDQQDLSQGNRTDAGTSAPAYEPLALEKVEIRLFHVKAPTPVSIQFDGLLGLNPVSMEVILENVPLLSPPLRLSASPAAPDDLSFSRFHRITCLRIEIYTLRGVYPAHMLDNDELFIFPSEEWKTTISQLLSTCSALKAFSVEFHVNVGDEFDMWNPKKSAIERELTLLNRVIAEMSYQVLGGEPHIKRSAPSIEVHFQITVWDKGLPLSTHPLFQQGTLKEQQLDDLLLITREVVLMEGASSGALVWAGRKAVTFTVTTDYHEMVTMLPASGSSITDSDEYPEYK